MILKSLLYHNIILWANLEGRELHGALVSLGFVGISVGHVASLSHEILQVLYDRKNKCFNYLASDILTEQHARCNTTSHTKNLHHARLMHAVPILALDNSRLEHREMYSSSCCPIGKAEKRRLLALQIITLLGTTTTIILPLRCAKLYK